MPGYVGWGVIYLWLQNSFRLEVYPRVQSSELTILPQNGVVAFLL
ncbi:MAG: hypothetical protein ACI9FG_001546 [Crocinitomicaceae bacterium]|jgi:hypothetical protein